LGEGKYGVLVDVRSPYEVGSAMLRLGQDRNARMELSAAGRATARLRFHIREVADRYEAIYTALASA
jgi:glycosyltransferase involved in cell wall biosynthesis